MKPFTLLLTVLFLTGTIACQKDNDGSHAQLLVSDEEVLAGEIVTAGVVNAMPGTTYQWDEPDYLSAEETDNGSRTRFFCTEEGPDTIHVTLCHGGRPYARLSKAIRVSKERYYAPDPLPSGSTLSLLGQTLYMNYFFMRDSTLAFLVKTNGMYAGPNNQLLARDTGFGKIIKASFPAVWLPTGGATGNLPAIAVLFTNTRYGEGQWPVAFTVHGRTHHGHLRVTLSGLGIKYEFILPPNNGLYIHPESLGVVYRRK